MVTIIIINIIMITIITIMMIIIINCSSFSFQMRSSAVGTLWWGKWTWQRRWWWRWSSRWLEATTIVMIVMLMEMLMVKVMVPVWNVNLQRGFTLQFKVLAWKVILVTQGSLCVKKLRNFGKSFDFYRTQVNLGSDLWVRMSVSPTPLWNLSMWNLSIGQIFY